MGINNTDESFKKAYKPFDIVSFKGSVGYIREVSINAFQVGVKDQLSYAVTWLTGDVTKHAWFTHEELKYNCNLFVKIAEDAVHPMGSSRTDVKKLMFGDRK